MSQAKEIVVELMRIEIRRARTPHKPAFLCGKDCEDHKAHNDHADQVAAQVQERYLETSKRRLARYLKTGEISSR